MSRSRDFLVEKNIKSFGFSEMENFLHESGIAGCKAGEPFGRRYFHKWRKKASENLGVAGLDLLEALGMVRSAIVVRKHFSPEQRPNRTMLGFYKAFER